MESLDLEEVDQEMAADEAIQSSATEADAPIGAPADVANPGDASADDASGRT